MSSVGLYVGVASYLNTGPVEIKTDVNKFYMATASNSDRVDRSGADGSSIGAPVGPFHACIAGVKGGNCDGVRSFKKSEYKFSVFGYASGADYDTTVVAGFSSS